MMTKTFTFKLWGILLLIVFAIVACDRDESIGDIDDSSKLENVGVLKAKEILKETFPQTKSGVFFIIPDLTNITQQAFNNSSDKITIAPLKIDGDNGYHRIYLFKMNDKIQKIICSMYVTDISNSKTFSGVILMRNIDGSFREAARFSEGKMVSYFKEKKVIQTKSSTPYGRFTLFASSLPFSHVDKYLDEVVVKAKKPQESGGCGFKPYFGEPYFLKPYVSGRKAFREWNFGKGGGYSPNPTPEVDDKEIENTKVGCIKDALEAGGNTSLINKLLKGFKLENSEIDVTYKMQDKVYSKKGNEVNGLCEYNKTTKQMTIFLSKTEMDKYSFLEAARTILHETFHAHLYAMVNLKDNGDHNTIPDADGIDFKNTWKEYIKLHPKEQQHNWMAERYISLMKKGLADLYSNWDIKTRTRFEDYYGVSDANRDFMFECIAWHGLLGKNHDMTEAGKEFYKKNGKAYEEMKSNTISGISKDCPF